MPSFLVPKNWGEFQHYKDRSPPWIRLHKRLLDDYDFQSLPVASRALAPMLWLLASDSADLKSGSIEFAPEKIAFRLRMPEKDLVDALKPLLDKGFFEVCGDAINLLAECEQVAVPETETETETEERERQKKARVPRFDAQAHLESLGVAPTVARDWLTLRSGKRLKPTETAFAGVLQEAQKAGLSMNDALRMCCKRGWGGFESSWVAQHSTPQSRASPPGWQEKNEATIAALTGRTMDYDSIERIIDV